MSNSRCRRSATAIPSTNGSPERPIAPEGSSWCPSDQLRQMPAGETEHAGRNAAAGHPSQPAPGQRIATAPVRQDAQHPARHQRRRDHSSLAGIHEIEPAQHIGREDRDSGHPDQHQYKGRGVGRCEHGWSGPERRIVPR